MKEGLPRVKDQLSGLRAELRDDRGNTLVIQNTVGDDFYIRINGEAIIIPVAQFKGVIDTLVSNSRKENR